MADVGQVRILAVMSSLRQSWSAPNIEVVNRFYGRPYIPIGVPAVNVFPAGDNYGSYIQNNFFHTLRDSTNAQNALVLYRQILAQRPDKSVTIVFAGQMKNLADLWRSNPDSISTLSGQSLLMSKVKKVIVVAGYFPTSNNTAEYNLQTDPTSGSILNSITSGVQVAFMGIEQGDTVKIGATIVPQRPATNPVREAFRLAAAVGFHYPRPSWTGLALLHAAHGYTWGTTNLFVPVKGQIFVRPESGTNSFTTLPESNQEHLIKAQPDDYYVTVLDELLMRIPRFPQSIQSQRTDTGQVEVTFTAFAGKELELQHSSDLTNWSTSETIPAAPNERTLSRIISTNDSPKYVRVLTQ
jgi:pyrimidine-specific ribonucleoside hydrolase